MAKESLKKMMDAMEASETTVFCVDAEFNSYKGELISIALVGVDGREFYAELPLPPTINGWVKDNVVPLLEFEEPLSLPQLQEDLESFLRPYAAIHIVADWPDDIKYFCDVLIAAPGERINTPPLTMEIRRDLDAPSALPHHALHDARGIRDLYLEKGDTKCHDLIANS